MHRRSKIEVWVLRNRPQSREGLILSRIMFMILLLLMLRWLLMSRRLMSRLLLLCLLLLRVIDDQFFAQFFPFPPEQSFDVLAGKDERRIGLSLGHGERFYHSTAQGGILRLQRPNGTLKNVKM